MKKYFRLEKLLEIRVMDERSAAAKLSDIDARLNRVQNDLDLIRKKQNQLYSEILNTIQTSGNLAHLQTHLTELKEEALALENSGKTQRENPRLSLNFVNFIDIYSSNSV